MSKELKDMSKSKDRVTKNLNKRKEEFIWSQGSIVKDIAEYIHENFLEMLNYLEIDNSNKSNEEEVRKVVAMCSSLEQGLKDHKKFIWDNSQRLEKKINSNTDKVDKNEVRQDDLEDKFDVFEHDTTGKYDKYKKTAQSRIFKLLGDDTVEYDLFYRSFILKIYSDTWRKLGANNSGSIKMSDSDKAIELVHNWTPSRKYVNKKIVEYSKKQSMKTLTKERDRAFSIFMNKTDGGLKLPF